MQWDYSGAQDSGRGGIESEIWRWTYVALAYCLAPFYLLRLALKALGNPGYRECWHHRLGFAPLFEDGSRPIWIHAVSVGEAIAIEPLVRLLKREEPGRKLLVTTTTPTGRAQVEKRYGDLVRHAYFPFDLPAIVQIFLKRVQPAALVLIETEIWPELIRACNRADVPVMLANARLSPRSLRAYRRIGSFVRATINSISHIAARSAADAERLLELGIHERKISIAGNLKHSLASAAMRARDLSALPARTRPQETRKWIAGSTHAGEDIAVLEAQQRIAEDMPAVQLIIAPRHPARAAAIARHCETIGLSVTLRSQPAVTHSEPDVYVVDTVGELAEFYAQAEVAFVGGSLVEKGGQNPMEPVAASVPVIVGPSTFNFESDFKALQNADALCVVRDATDLATTVTDLLGDPERRAGLAARAAEVLTQQQDAADRVAAIIRQTISGQPHRDPVWIPASA